VVRRVRCSPFIRYWRDRGKVWNGTFNPRKKGPGKRRRSEKTKSALILDRLAARERPASVRNGKKNDAMGDSGRQAARKDTNINWGVSPAIFKALLPIKRRCSIKARCCTPLQRLQTVPGFRNGRKKCTRNDSIIPSKKGNSPSTYF